jgi:histidine kinase
VAPRGWVSWALAMLAAAQIALGSWWLVSGTVLVPVVGEALLLALLALVLVGSRYGRFRRAYEQDVARRAAQSERIRLAEDLHDVLGHELSLIALRAGALQLGSSGGIAEQAAELRAQVEHAVLQLHQTVRLLQGADDAPAGLEPLGIDLPALIDRARSAGADVTASGWVPAEVSAPARLMAHRVVQEGLTNAAKHAPEAPVRVQLGMADGVVDVAVETEGSPRAERATGTGLASLRRRLEAIGGDLQVHTPDGLHVLHARVPSTTTAAGAPGVNTVPVGAAASGGRTAVRGPGAATARWVLRPALAVAAATVAFYTWATAGATLEDEVFTGLKEGQSVSQAAAVLPARQASVRLLTSAPAPPGSHCAYYPDGNFPLAMAAFEICDDGARLTRITDLRELPFR